MNPAGILVVAVLMVAFAAYRWMALSRRGQFSARTEWPFWLFAGSAVAVSIVVTVMGRVAMLVLTPFILIPAGAYMLQWPDAATAVGGFNLRTAGWLAIVTGILGGLAALASIVAGQ